MPRPWVLGVYTAAALILVGVGMANIPALGSAPSTMAWILGAGALGLLSGFVAGASDKEGIAGELLRFISGGILVPLFGGAVALMQFRGGSKESYTYEGELLKTKTIEPHFPAGAEPMHPIWVLGAFFVAYGLGAILGILLGMILRYGGGYVIKRTP